VTWKLVFNEQVKPDVVRKMIDATLDGSNMPVEIEEQDNRRTYLFTIKNITRQNVDRQLLISINGASDGISRKETLSVKIPATDKFKLHDYEVISAPEHALRLIFSDLVSESQDLKSMITLKNVSSYTTQLQGNQVMVYFTPRSNEETLTATIHKGLKNRRNESLDEPSEITFSLKKLKPQVEILTSGIIMPNSEKLILPFRAVRLYAVDLRIIRIYENNILMFLQNNRLSQHSSNQLRRAGRLVYANTLRLDTDPSKRIEAWEHYSLDLTGLFKQQPGAIYRIELSFNKAYASYDCEDETERKKALGEAGGQKKLFEREDGF
jgi:uncharacterized protein YfaS (alpha-2-macroglobulin family)